MIKSCLIMFLLPLTLFAQSPPPEDVIGRLDLDQDVIEQIQNNILTEKSLRGDMDILRRQLMVELEKDDPNFDKVKVLKVELDNKRAELSDSRIKSIMFIKSQLTEDQRAELKKLRTKSKKSRNTSRNQDQDGREPGAFSEY